MNNYRNYRKSSAENKMEFSVSTEESNSPRNTSNVYNHYK